MENLVYSSLNHQKEMLSVDIKTQENELIYQKRQVKIREARVNEMLRRFRELEKELEDLKSDENK